MGTQERPRMLMEIFQHHNDQLAVLIGREFLAATLERYNTSRDHTKAFLQWKMSKHGEERDFLTEDELQAITSKDLGTDGLNHVRDIFVFSCFTGLVYAVYKN